MCRKNKLKLTNSQFKEYLLDKYVDENGEKVSVREVWDNLEFKKHSGMYQINKYTKVKDIVSTGTISYWNKKLNLTEKEIYDFHFNITKRIKETDYSIWSKQKNKGHIRKRCSNLRTIKNGMIRYFGFNERYKRLSYRAVEQLADKLVGADEVKKFYIFFGLGGDGS